MHRWLRVLGTLSGLVLSATVAFPAAAAPPAPMLLQTVTVPGKAGHFDVIAVDPGSRHLYISHTSNGTLDVMDLDTAMFVAEIPGLPVSVNAKGATSGANGLAVGANVGKVFVADQVDDALHVFDMATNTQTDVIPTTQKGSDSVAYDSADKKVYVTNPSSKTITVVDATNDTVLSQIKLPSAPELSFWDPFDDTIHQNLSKTNQQAVIDAKTDTVKVVFNLPPGCSPHGGDLDPSNQHVVVACGGQMTVIMDGGNGRILSLTSDVGNEDTVAFNPVDHRFYTASSGNKPKPALGAIDAATGNWIANAPSDSSAHSIAVDPMTGRVYLASQKTGTVLVFTAGASVSQLP